MKKNLSLYIHIPFCIKKCGYCDFVSFEGHEKYFEEYTFVLAKQIAQWEQKNNYIIDTIFLGGGTPSCLCVNLTEKIFNAIYKNYHIAENCEITTEVNPKTITYEKAKAYKEMGINRISIGLQAKQDRLLKILGRIHTLNDFIKSYEILQSTGFKNINIDIMSSLPCQTEKDLTETLEFAVSLNPAHICAYSLIIEENTPFFSLYNDKSNLFPDEETDRKMYHNAVSFLREHNYIQYEISNFSKPDFQCRHNKKYWKRQEYKGFGINASSFINNVRSTITPVLSEYLINPNLCESEAIDKRTARSEFMFLGLRMNEGISEKEFEKNFGISVFKAYPNVLEGFINNGFLNYENGQISLTAKGIDVSNSIFCEFV